MATDKPKIDLNLDALERENTPEPFSFVLGGKRFVATDPQDLDWQVLEDLNPNDARAVMGVFLEEDDLKEFLGHKLPAWKVSRLAERLTTHYGLVESGKPAAS